MRLSFAALLLALAPITFCVVVPDTHIVHEKREVTSSSWVKRRKVSSNSTLSMRVGLRQSNLEGGYDFLMDVSDPKSSNYAKHWTSEEVVEKFAPPQETVKRVTDWLINSGIAEKRITHSDNKGWLAFQATAEEAENLLHTEYHEYEHVSKRYVTRACESYSLPKHIREHVDYITPGVRLGTSRPRSLLKRASDTTSRKGRRSVQQRDQNNLGCDKVMTPDCIAELYGIPEPEYPNGQPRSDNSMGLFEEGTFYAQEDLDMFYAQYANTIPKGTRPTPAFVDGAQAPVNVTIADFEPDMDMQLIYPLIYPQNVTLFQVDDIFYSKITIANPGVDIGFLNTFLDAIDGSYCTFSFEDMQNGLSELDPQYPDPNANGFKGQLQCGIYKPTNVISVSYSGWEGNLPEAYIARQCNEFMKLGLQGVSIFFASGDSGVSAPDDPYSESGCLGTDQTIFNPNYPSSCPYVTSVGATKLYPGQTTNDSESAANDPINQPYATAFSSGGGFSNVFTRPSYQDAAVSSYFADYSPPYPYYSGKEGLGHNGGLYNRSGRGYPDVSANGDNIATFVRGVLTTGGGSSASVPIFASIINRINELRLNSGKKPVGFINPALYSNPGMLNDIVNGSNPGCGTNGFSCVKGWDPVTGLGTPNYPKMVEYFMSLP